MSPERAEGKAGGGHGAAPGGSGPRPDAGTPIYGQRAMWFGTDANQVGRVVTRSVIPITVVLSRPGMEPGGFQLAARYASDTTQAGSFDVAERDRERARMNSDDILFHASAVAGDGDESQVGDFVYVFEGSARYVRNPETGPGTAWSTPAGTPG